MRFMMVVQPYLRFLEAGYKALWLLGNGACNASLKACSSSGVVQIQTVLKQLLKSNGYIFNAITAAGY